MDIKTRTLLWEELRTGGAIAGWCTLVSTLLMIGIRLANDSWQFVYGPVMCIALGSIVALIFLLLYRTGNSGHLTGGFSGRVLLLPVETRLAVATALLSRSFLILAAGTIVFSFNRLLFGFGPGWPVVPLIATLYLTLQCLDWSRRPLPHWTALCFVGLLVLLVLSAKVATRVSGMAHEGNFVKRMYNTLGEVPTSSAGDFPISMLSALIVLLVTGATVYFLSKAVVNRTRRGERQSLKLRATLLEDIPVPFGPRDDAFGSPRRAALWHFLRKEGVFFPVFALPLCLLCLGIGWAIVSNVNPEGDGNNPMMGLSAVGEFAPWIAFLLAAMAWGVLRGGVGLQRGERPNLTQYLYPQSSADMTAMRLLGHVFLLAFVGVFFTLISNAIFLSADSALMWRIFAGSYGAGETDLRELLSIRLPLPILALLGAWLLMVIRTRLVVYAFSLQFAMWGVSAFFYEVFAPTKSMFYDAEGIGVVVLIAALVVVTVSSAVGAFVIWKTGLNRKAIAPILGSALIVAWIADMAYTDTKVYDQLFWLAVALILVSPAATIAWAFRRGLIPLHHLLLLFGIWVVSILFVYPFGTWEFSGIDRESLLIATTFGALVVFPYPALLIDFHRRRHQEDSAQCAEELRRRPQWKSFTPARAFCLGLVLTLGLGATWLRWPTTPAYIETLRAQGMPATPADLAAFYAPGPAEINAAYGYLDLMSTQSTLEKTWETIRAAREQEPDSKRIYDDDNPVTYGVVYVNPDEPMWSEDWKVALERYGIVEGPLTQKMDQFSIEDYAQCRFPVNAGEGNISHMLSLRTLARAQAFAISVAAFEDRPDDVLRHLPSLIHTAESLRDEPFLISQLVRMALHGIMVTSLEQALSRTEFTEAQLLEIQRLVSQALPSAKTDSMMHQALIGERVLISKTEMYDPVTGEALNPAGVYDQFSYYQGDRVAILRGLAALLENKTQYEPPLLQEIADATNPYLLLTKITVPSFGVTLEAEWRCRVNNDLAATACAVLRYRLANGVLPSSLEELLPQIMDALPVDPFREDGGPVSFRQDDAGAFRIYSWSYNRKDDNGDIDKDRNGWRDGDWVFPVASPTFRDGPQLTDVPPADGNKRR